MMNDGKMELGPCRGTDGWNRGSAFATRLPPSLGSYGGTRRRGGSAFAWLRRGKRGREGIEALARFGTAAGHRPARRGENAANLPGQGHFRALDRPAEPEPRPEEIWFAATLRENTGRGAGGKRIRDNFPGCERTWRYLLPPGVRTTEGLPAGRAVSPGRTGRLPVPPMPKRGPDYDQL
jgi:hypothetical protein